MSLDGFRQKHEYAESRGKFTDFSLRQAYVGAEATLQEGRAIRYDKLADPQTLGTFQETLGKSLLDNASKAFPQGVINWGLLKNAQPQEINESIDDITFGLYGVSVGTATGLVKHLGKDATFENYVGNAGKSADQGLHRHSQTAFEELTDPATLADFESTIVDSDALIAIKQKGGYQPQILGMLILSYDSINDGKAPADVRKLTKSDVMRILSKQ
ncbi:hypothetical protein HY483_03545 [Candidatus Woesearchaeota archaeon]|nr:hypothetical protein [Candidatus Woesearchaeota archaeon]